MATVAIQLGIGAIWLANLSIWLAAVPIRRAMTALQLAETDIPLGGVPIGMAGGPHDFLHPPEASSVAHIRASGCFVDEADRDSLSKCGERRLDPGKLREMSWVEDAGPPFRHNEACQ